MTDTASSRLSNDMIQLIANNHFTIPELMTLRKINRDFNQALSSQDFLLNLYKHLCFLNKTLPVTFSSEHAFFDVQMAFKKVKERQNEEIAFLDLYYANPNDLCRVKINQLLKAPAETIPQMIFRDKLLNDLNCCIIDLMIFQNEEIEHLTLTGITRFIYETENADYIKKVKILTLSDSSIAVLNFENFTKMQELRCREIKLMVLNIKGCTSLKEVICDKNRIQCLSIDNASVLKKLRCQENQIKDLDISGLVALQGVHCEGNQLVNFNAKGCKNLLWLHIEHNPKLTSLNLQDCCQLTRVVKDSNHNYLMTLNISGTALEKKSEWISLKKRVELRDSAQKLRLSSQQEAADLSNTFSKMSIYTPSFRKEKAVYSENAEGKNKEHYKVKSKVQL